MESYRTGLRIVAFISLWFGVQAWAAGPVIEAGLGAGFLRVGAIESQVVDRLGQPDHAFYGYVYVYRMPDGTRVTYRTSRERIVSINFAGGPGARYRTDRGARFGMSQEDVIARYGLPDTQIGANFFYDRLGIGFYFRDARLSEMWVYPKGTLTPAVAQR